MSVPRYAVFGHPVAHSRSPAIHAAFAAQVGVALEYVRIDAAPEAFDAAVERFARDGGRGANVTLPHKAAALALCPTLGERAARAGAVNTLVRLDDGGGSPRWQGDNTDGIGLVRDLRDRHGLALDGAHVLLLGAGGAACGVAPALLDAGIARLSVANRNVERAAALAAHLHDERLRPCGWGLQAMADDESPPVDLVINTTSAARGDVSVDWPLPRVRAPRWTAVDLGYGEAAASFLGLAGAHGAHRRIDGLGMLVEQAAESFRLWHGIAPATSPVLEALRAEVPSP